MASTPTDRSRHASGFRQPAYRTTLLAGLVFLTGCSSYTVKVDSLAKPDANAQSYQIRNKNPLVEDDSLRYKEIAGHVETALSGKGLFEAPPKVKPDMVIDLDYGLGPPQSRVVTHSEPVYREVPGAIRYETVQSGTDAQGRPIYTTKSYREPSRQVFQGMREYQETIVVYEKYLRMTARENVPETEGSPPQEIWTVDVISEGESRDLRKYVPILAAASIEYVGKDSHGQKTIKLKDKDADVAFVKRGM